MAFKTSTTESGFALLLSIIISSVVLSIGLTLLSVTIKQLNLTTTGRESEIAFHMANLGLECGQYWQQEHILLYANPNAIIIPTTDTDTLKINCAGNIEQPTNTLISETIQGGDGTLHTAEYSFDVNVNGESRYVHMTTYVIVNTSNNDINYLTGRVRTECEAMQTCTVIVSQGYNRSQAEVQAKSIFTVQRELTLVF